MAKDYTKAYVSPSSGNLITPRCRMIYPSLVDKTNFRSRDGSEPRQSYSVTLLSPKEADWSEVTKACDAARMQAFGKSPKVKLLDWYYDTAGDGRYAEYSDEYLRRVVIKNENSAPNIAMPAGKNLFKERADLNVLAEMQKWPPEKLAA